MRILLITEEMWNDQLQANNVLQNWFDGFDAEFANISCSPGVPYNNCCTKYFQITDSMMAKSLFGKGRAGRAFEYNKEQSHEVINAEQENKQLYSRIKVFAGEPLRALRELIWSWGRYDLDALKKFIDDFDPDIIFSARKATIKVLRLEKIVYDYAKVPIVAFTGDSEYSLRNFKFSPFFWARKFALRAKLRHMMPNYALYYTLSDEQKDEYTYRFGDKFKILRKCGDFSDDSVVKQAVNDPIKIVYAGKLYSNRDKTLAKLAENISKVNKDDIKIVLNIYTLDKITQKQREKLDDGKNTFLMGGVLPSELKEVYKKADIALHVESFDLKNRSMVRVSFSTKIIDCFASGCAVMVISWNQHSGYTYLQKKDAGIMIDSFDNMYDVLCMIANNPKMIIDYSKKAFACGKDNHSKAYVQKYLYNDLKRIIDQHKKTHK
jgi:hypothetical protein